MKIWDKIIFGATTIGSISVIAIGAYYCLSVHYPIPAIILLTAGGGFLTLSCNRLLDKKDGYFECSYKEEENVIEFADKIIAYQEERMQQMREEENKKEIEERPNIALQMAEVAHPQLQQAKDGHSTPKSSPKNPFMTNEFFNADIEEVQK